MNCQKSSCQCTCSEESVQDKYQKISDVIEAYKNREGSLIQVLHISQGIFGYLPLEVQKFIAERMELHLSEVSGVVTFYSFFSTEPRGKHTIRVCLGTACYVRGGKKLVDRLESILGIQIGGSTKDQKFNFEVARCLGACGLAPAMMIDDVVYKQVNPDKLEAILAKY
jgi:NADH:ubiquinone oxidoreductase subunit E